VREQWYRSGYYRDETLSSVLRRAARAHADTPFRFHTAQGLRETTVGEIGRDAVRLAGALGVLGLRPGEDIAVQLPTCYETAVLYVAALHAGATVLPIVHTYGPAELDFILKDSRARWLAIPGEWRGIDYGERCARTPAVDALQGIILLGDRPMPRGIPWRELVERGAHAPPPAPLAQPADERSVLLYTSGTTARPKGVVHSHNTIHFRPATSPASTLSCGRCCAVCRWCSWIASMPMLPPSSCSATPSPRAAARLIFYRRSSRRHSAAGAICPRSVPMDSEPPA
jgi:acyl-coenzyme A synthetase/AMP-(fatty) acid ligase